MNEKIILDGHAFKTRDMNINALPESIDRYIHPKHKGLDDETLWAMNIRGRRHIQPTPFDLRMFVRIQRKNKHPHSTKKHK